MTIVHTGRQTVVVLNTTEGDPGRFEATAVPADPVLLTGCRKARAPAILANCGRSLSMTSAVEI